MFVPRVERRADCTSRDLGRGLIDTKAKLRDLLVVSESTAITESRTQTNLGAGGELDGGLKGEFVRHVGLSM